MKNSGALVNKNAIQKVRRVIFLQDFWQFWSFSQKITKGVIFGIARVFFDLNYPKICFVNLLWQIFDVPKDIMGFGSFLSTDRSVVQIRCHFFSCSFAQEFDPAFGEISSKFVFSFVLFFHICKKINVIQQQQYLLCFQIKHVMNV